MVDADEAAAARTARTERSERSDYGVILDAEWWRAVVRSEHPADGSPVFTAEPSAAAPPGAVVLLLHGVGNDGSVFEPIMSSLTDLGTIVAPTLSPELLTDVGDERNLMSAKLVEITQRIPKSRSAHGACSRDEPQPKLFPATRIWQAENCGSFRTKSVLSEPSSLKRQ